MKKSLYFLLTLLVLTACKDEKKENPETVPTTYELIGTIDGSKDGTTVYLKEVEDDMLMAVFSKETIIDSTEIKDGKFQFTGELPEAKLHIVEINSIEKSEDPRMPNYQPSFPIFIENGKIQIKAKLDSIPTATALMQEAKFPHKNVKVSGSKNHDIYLDYEKGIKPFADKNDKLFMGDYVGYLNPGKDKKKGPVSQGVEIVTKIDANKADRQKFMFDFIKKNADNMVGLTLANQEVSRLSLLELEELEAIIPEVQKETDLGKNVITKLNEMKRVAPGAEYVDLPFKDTKGNSMKLSDYVGKGKYVLLEFWASWCGPCRADIPHLKEVYKLYNPEGFEIISVSMDEDKDKWLGAVKEEKMKWLQVSDMEAFDGDLSKIYKIRGIPTCVLVDPNGKIVTRNMRGSFMDKRLIEMYGNKFSDKF